MPATSRSFSLHRLALLAVVIVGLAASVLVFRQARSREQLAMENELERRADVHHTLVREIFGQYDAALFGLRSLVVVNGNIADADFIRAARPLLERNPGVRAFEWVPAVSRENRAAVEAALNRDHGKSGLHFTERNAAGQLTPAADRAVYFPIIGIEPLADNEPALGYDLKSGPTARFLESAAQNPGSPSRSPDRLRSSRTRAPGNTASS